ncbi:MAG: hypothetical protein JNK82_12665 [Myxococcaceae bacterium]|nr:hypothetical protein [Myxococcaceae bacterium]
MRAAFVIAALVSAVGCGPKPMPAPPDSGSPPVHYPVVPNNGGAVLADAELVSVTLGPDVGQHAAWLRWLVDSGWLTERAGEYGVTRVTFGGALELPAPPAEQTDEQLKASLRTLQPQQGRLYVIWGPPGAAIIDRYGLATCFTIPGTGYHEVLDAEEVPYVVVPGCSSRFGGSVDQVQAMHIDGTRLIINALTNPSPRNAPAFALSDSSNVWFALGVEVGDFCWNRIVQRDGQILLRVWSNSAVLADDEPCLPAPPGPAFGFSVEPAGRRAMVIGEEQQLVVRGWSKGPREDWLIDVTPWTGDFGMKATLDKTTLNGDQSAGLSLTVPYPVPRRTQGSVLLRARGGDDSPLWPISFVVRDP